MFVPPAQFDCGELTAWEGCLNSSAKQILHTVVLHFT